MKILQIPKLGDQIVALSYKRDGDRVHVKYFDAVQAGFPSPAEDFEDLTLSLDERYLKDPDSTYLVKVVGDSMYPTLNIGDILVVKSHLPVSHNDIIIVSVNNTDFTVKRFDQNNNALVADNPSFPSIKLQEEDILINLGVVKHLVRDL